MRCGVSFSPLHSLIEAEEYVHVDQRKRKKSQVEILTSKEFEYQKDYIGSEKSRRACVPPSFLFRISSSIFW